MSSGRTTEITVLLHAAALGDEDASGKVYSLLYDELHRLARRQLYRQGRQSLETTDLVHEAYLKIAGSGGLDYTDRGHFLCLAARAMRQILVDHARKKGRQKRGGGALHETLQDEKAFVREHIEQVLAVDQALKRVGGGDSRLTSIVECKYFAGYTEVETAEALGLSERTVRRLWQRARHELKAQLSA